MIKNIYITISILILSLTFTKSAYANEEQLEQIKGIEDARKSSTTVHQNYLMCYARKDKAICHEKIIDENQIFNEELLSSNSYLNSFSYEAERLGFLWFLQNHNLSCDTIDEGPLYKEDIKAYEVICRNGNKFYMQFDYKTFLWHLKNN